MDAEILFSRIQGTLRRVKDDQCYEALVHAYNEYLIEEYAVVAPDRLIPMGVIPTSGIEAAMRELEYCGRMGFKGVLIDKFPAAGASHGGGRSVLGCLPRPEHAHHLAHRGRQHPHVRPDEPSFEFPKIPGGH